MRRGEPRNPNRQRRQIPLAIACHAALAACALAQPAHAGTFSLDNGIEGRWSLGASLGAAWRARGADPALIGVGNGGAASDGNDDGSLNYGKGKVFSTPFKLVGDVSIKRENLGAFVRAKGWYDFETKRRGVPHGSFANAYVAGAKLEDGGFDERLSKFSGAELVDAYVFGDFRLGGKPLSVRLGQQVVNWGESLFIPGINQYGTFDVPAAHRPGSQVKEILLPVPQVWLSAGITDALSVEAFYQFQWKKTVLDGCGTYWSPADSINCPGMIANPLPVPDSLAFAGIPALGGLNARMDRLPDNEPSNSGQFGVAMRYRAQPIDTEFGVYFVNYHQRLPALGLSKSPSGPTSIWQAGVVAPTGLRYFWDYGGENIKVLGLSASTVLGGWSVFGEASYTRGLPVAFSGDSVLGAIAGAGPYAEFGALPAGSTISGFDRKNKSQLQVGTLKVFPRVIAADTLTLLGEVAYQHWSGIGDPMTSRRYGRSPSFGQAETATLPCALTGNPNPAFCEAKGFATPNAWGYRIAAELAYTDVVAGANFKPRLYFAHDVKGYSADGTFLEDRKTMSLGLRVDFRERYFVDFSVSGYDRKAKYDSQRDREHYTFVLGFNL